MRELNQQILRAFGLKLKNYKRVFGCYICETNNGLKMVKKCSLPYDKLLFIHSAKNYLNKNGFNNIDQYSTTVKDNLPYYEYNKTMYIVKNWTNGQECDFTDLHQIIQAVKTLANMHNAAKGMKPIKGSRINNKLGLLLINMEKHYKELMHMYKKAYKLSRWNEFDIYFIKNYKEYLYEASRAIEIMQHANYDELVKSARIDKVFCHNRYTNHNLHIEQDDIMVTDFVNCCYKLPLCDLVRLMEKVMRKSDWNIDIGEEIIKTYDSICSLNEDELTVIFCLLCYPQKFWELSNQHYNSRRSWMPKIFEIKIKNIIEQKENKSKFLDEYYKNL